MFDDSRLIVDAVGLDITVQTPWYGGEVGLASTEFTGHQLPLIDLNLSQGESVNMALRNCGLTPSIGGNDWRMGQWVSLNTLLNKCSAVFTSKLSEGEAANVSLEYAVSADGESFFFIHSTPRKTRYFPEGEAYKNQGNCNRFLY